MSDERGVAEGSAQVARGREGGRKTSSHRKYPDGRIGGKGMEKRNIMSTVNGDVLHNIQIFTGTTDGEGLFRVCDIVVRVTDRTHVNTKAGNLISDRV